MQLLLTSIFILTHGFCCNSSLKSLIINQQLNHSQSSNIFSLEPVSFQPKLHTKLLNVNTLVFPFSYLSTSFFELLLTVAEAPNMIKYPVTLSVMRLFQYRNRYKSCSQYHPRVSSRNYTISPFQKLLGQQNYFLQYQHRRFQERSQERLRKSIMRLQHKDDIRRGIRMKQKWSSPHPTLPSPLGPCYSFQFLVCETSYLSFSTSTSSSLTISETS